MRAGIQHNKQSAFPFRMLARADCKQLRLANADEGDVGCLRQRPRGRNSRPNAAKGPGSRVHRYAFDVIESDVLTCQKFFNVGREALHMPVAGNVKMALPMFSARTQHYKREIIAGGGIKRQYCAS